MIKKYIGLLSRGNIAETKTANIWIKEAKENLKLDENCIGRFETIHFEI